MSNKQFISNLSATYADIRKLDVKKINLKGKNILEYINDATFNGDTRDPQLKNDELDIWNAEISINEKGYVEVKPHVHGIKRNEDTNWENVYEGMTESQYNIIKTAVKVIDNEVLGANDEHIMYWQTNGLTDASDSLYYCENLTTFNSGLSSLTYGENMFNRCEKLTSFSADLSSLTDSEGMFASCYSLTTFSSDLPSLTNGKWMFYKSGLETFSSDLSSLTNGYQMFYYCSNLESFNGDLSSLTNGYNMF
jgi:hypothetical protein